MHTHRPLFTSARMNRVVDFLCCLPGGLTGADMREVHVLNHHRFNDGPRDVTSTANYERGLRAVWYWITYSPIIHLHTIRTVFAANPSVDRRRRRHQYLVDVTLLLVLIGVTVYFTDTNRFLLFQVVPFVATQVNAGYFAWLTHAPARVFDDDPSKSINTVGNVLNFFIFNQGYHSVHHRYPGIHWSEIADKLDFMRQVHPGVVVPYWMTLNSAWRVCVPGASSTRPTASDGKPSWKSGSTRAASAPATCRGSYGYDCATADQGRADEPPSARPVPVGAHRLRACRCDRALAAVVRRRLVAAEDRRHRSTPLDRSCGRHRCGAARALRPAALGYGQTRLQGVPHPPRARTARAHRLHRDGLPCGVDAVPGLATDTADDLVGRRCRRRGTRCRILGGLRAGLCRDPAAEPLPACSASARRTAAM